MKSEIINAQTQEDKNLEERIEEFREKIVTYAIFLEEMRRGDIKPDKNLELMTEEKIKELRTKIRMPSSLQQICELINLDKRIKTDEVGGQLYEQGDGLRFYEIPSQYKEEINYMIKEIKHLKWKGLPEKKEVYIETIKKSYEKERPHTYFGKKDRIFKNFKYICDFHIHSKLYPPSGNDILKSGYTSHLVISYGNFKNKEEFFVTFLLNESLDILYKTPGLKKGSLKMDYIIEIEK